MFKSPYQSNITQKLENEHIPKLLFQYALPAVIGTLVNAIYNVVDRIFIGQGVGALAISGLALTFPILIFMQAFGMLVGAGSGARVSINLGRNNKKDAERVLGNALTLTIIINVVTISLAMIFMDDLLLLFGGSPETIPYAKDYLQIVIPGNIFAAFSFGFSNIMRASGYPKKSMYTMLIGAGLNLILDPFFIFVLKMGIEGVAIATVISLFICSIYVMSHYFNKNSLIRFHKEYLKPNKQAIFNIINIGIAPFSIQITASGVNVLLNKTLQTHGGDFAVGANGIVNSFAMLLIMITIGIAQGMQPIIGYNFGAKKYDRVRETLKIAVIACVIVTGIGFLFSQIMPRTLVKAFTNDPELIDLSANALKITLMAFLVVGLQVCITNFFQSIGVASKAIILSLSRQVIFLIPFIIILTRYYGLNGVWMSFPLSDIAATILAYILVKKHLKRFADPIKTT